MREVASPLALSALTRGYSRDRGGRRHGVDALVTATSRQAVFEPRNDDDDDDEFDEDDDAEDDDNDDEHNDDDDDDGKPPARRAPGRGRRPRDDGASRLRKAKTTRPELRPFMSSP